MFNTSMPSAPAAFSRLMISQKNFSSRTVCTEHQSLSARGSTVGLLMPGRICSTVSSCVRGTFIRMYFLPEAAFTASKRNSSSSSTSCFSALRAFPPMSTASESITFSTSLRLLLTRVLPDDTMSKIASARPMLGAISTEPLISCSSAEMLLSRKNLESMTGYEVAIFLPLNHCSPS